MAQLSTQEIRTHPIQNSISLLGHQASNEASKLVTRIYSILTQSGLVKMSLEQFNSLTQSLLQTFEGSRTQVSKKISRWAFSPTLYNQLMELWLLQNLPFVSGKIKPFENFAAAFNSLHKKSKFEKERNFMIKSFHDLASAEWLSLQNPSVQELFNSLLKTVANLVNNQFGFEDQVFSQVLYGNLQLILEDLLEFANQNRFISNVWDQLDETHRSKGQELIQEATKEYFNSAKRFILINHPSRISERNLLVLFRGLIEDKTLACGNLALNLVEQSLDKLMKFVHADYSGPKEASGLIQKSERILRKIFVLSLLPLKYSSEKALGFKDKKAYITADKYINLTDKLDNAIYYSMWSYDILKTKAVFATYDHVILKFNKTKTFVTATLQGLNANLVKKNIERLSKQYHVLNRTRLVIQENVARLVFDQNTIREFGINLKAKVHQVYQRLKELEAEKIKTTGNQYYKWLLKKYQNIPQKHITAITDKIEKEEHLLIKQIEEKVIIQKSQVEVEERKEEVQPEVKAKEEEESLNQNKENEVEQASTEDSTLRQEDIHEDLNVRDIPMTDDKPTQENPEVETEAEATAIEKNEEENNQNESQVNETQKKKKGKGKNKKH